MVPFLDSNVLIYAYSSDARAQAARDLAARPHVISVQVLNEFAAVSRRKLGLDWETVQIRLDAIMGLAGTIVPLTTDLHRTGMAVAVRYRLAIYDSMIVAAALEAGCDTVYSEDMQNGLVIADCLTIRNPFA